MTQAPTTLSPTATPAGTLLPSVVIGFATAIAMWVLWVITHHPSINLPPVVIGLILLAMQVASTAWWVRRVSGPGLKIGALAGATTGIVNLLLLGSKMVEQIKAAGASAQPAQGLEGLPSSAPLAFVLFVVGSALLGAIGAGIGSVLGPVPTAGEHTRQRWLWRFAVVAAIGVVPLLVLGGAVTSANAGLSVPDWPGTYGANMFLYPISLMSADPRIYLEHTHRLFGSLIGLTTLTLMLATFVVERRTWPKVFVSVLFLAVVAQGVVGGVWVNEKLRWMPVLHGIFAQLYFGSAIAFAAALSPGMTRIVADPRNAAAAGAAKLARVLLVVLAVQLSVGAMYRHLQSKHALFMHMGVSLVVVVLAILVGAKMKKARADGATAGRELGGFGGGVMHSVFLQFLLGWLAFMVVAGAGSRVNPTSDQLATTEVVSVWHALVRTAHQANGALLLAMAVLSAMWATRVAAAVGPSGSSAAAPGQPKPTAAG